MIGKRKKWMYVFLVTCIACLSFSYTQTSADFLGASSLDLPTGFDPDASVHSLIINYCTKVLSSGPFMQDVFVYNAKQSAFVYLLCSNFRLDAMFALSPLSSQLSPDYFKRKTFDQLGFTNVTVDDIDLCNPASLQNDCDLATNVPKLFNDIMNDYVNMKQPNLYGFIAEYKSEPEMNNQINIFSSGYFDGVQICGSDKDRYPKTCKMMQGYIRNVRNIFSDVSVFNTTGVFDMLKIKNAEVEAALRAKKPDPFSCAFPTTTTDIFYCGLYGDKGARLNSFVNLAYNEMFYYRLFMGYYLSMIQAYPEYLKKTTFLKDYNIPIKTFSTQYMWSKDALSLSLKMMRDTYMAFPFHIGFSMYQEDLDGFAKAVARIAPPIYTLYDKLRNVQKPE